ncbi:MAG: hypothetical protein U0798_01210 [Gemmataceae bacterium]
MATITVSDEVFTRIQSQAAMRSKTIDQLLTQLLGEAPPGFQSVKGEERKQLLQELNEDILRIAKKLPDGFQLDDSRETIYGEQLGRNQSPAR